MKDLFENYVKKALDGIHTEYGLSRSESISLCRKHINLLETAFSEKWSIQEVVSKMVKEK